MPCYANGLLVGPAVTIVPAVREVLQDSTVFGVPKVIAIDWTATFEAQLEQLTMHWGGIPATKEDAILTKVSVTSPSFDTILRNIDPADELITDWVLLAPYRFRTGDHVKFDYPNSDNLLTAVEIILREV